MRGGAVRAENGKWGELWRARIIVHLAREQDAEQAGVGWSDGAPAGGHGESGSCKRPCDKHVTGGGRCECCISGLGNRAEAM